MGAQHSLRPLHSVRARPTRAMLGARCCNVSRPWPTARAVAKPTARWGTETAGRDRELSEVGARDEHEVARVDDEPLPRPAANPASAANDASRPPTPYSTTPAPRWTGEPMTLPDLDLAVPGVEEWRDSSYRCALRLPHEHGIAALRPMPDHIACPRPDRHERVALLTARSALADGRLCLEVGGTGRRAGRTVRAAGNRPVDDGDDRDARPRRSRRLPRNRSRGPESGRPPGTGRRPRDLIAVASRWRPWRSCAAPPRRHAGRARSAALAAGHDPCCPSRSVPWRQGDDGNATLACPRQPQVRGQQRQTQVIGERDVDRVVRRQVGAP